MGSIDRETAFWIIGFFFGIPITILIGMLLINIEAHGDRGDRSRSIRRLSTLLGVVSFAAAAAVLLAINLTQQSDAVDDVTSIPTVGELSMGATERPVAADTATSLPSTAEPSPTPQPTETPLPTETPEPTAEPTATAEPTSPPMPTPPPAAGMVLYEANTSESFAEWSGAGGWHTAAGMLVNDGTDDSAMLIRAPYQVPMADYAIEVEMKWVRGGETFGIVARAGTDGSGYWFGAWPRCNADYDFVWTAPPDDSCDMWLIHGRSQSIAFTERELDSEWHTYRLEVQGNEIRTLLDGEVMMETSDNQFLTSGRVGLWSHGAQVSVARFSVIALGDDSVGSQMPSAASTDVALSSSQAKSPSTGEPAVDVFGLLPDIANLPERTNGRAKYVVKMIPPTASKSVVLDATFSNLNC